MTNRRDFLRLFSGMTLTIPVLAATRRQTREAKMSRIACNSWPFRGYFDTPEMHHYRNPRFPLLQQAQFPEFLADTFGIHAVEFLPQHFAETSAAYVAEVKRGVEKAHSTVVNLMGVEIPGGLYNPHLDQEKAMAAARTWIDIAVALGSPSATFPLGGKPPFDTRVAAGNLRPIVAYARKRNIRVLFHNDDIRRETAAQILEVMGYLHHAGVGTCPDFGNFAPRSAAYALETLRQLMPFASNICHAKDGIANDGVHFAADDFPASMAVTRQDHFRGHYSLEFEGLGDPIPGVRTLLEKTLAGM